MRPTSSLGLLAVVVTAFGCAAAPSAPVVYDNPALVPLADRDFVWDQLVDVVDDYFEIEREQRVRLVGDVLTVGRIDTFPAVGSTLLEPGRNDSADSYEKLESTLQSTRRRALVQVIPADGGLLVDVAVFKELEDVPRPDFATAGAATLRHDTSQPPPTEAVGGQAPTAGWIALGRDGALEQRMIGQLMARLGGSPGRPRPF